MPTSHSSSAAAPARMPPATWMLVLCAAGAGALQHHREIVGQIPGAPLLGWVSLDEGEVQRRGAVCMDGSTPGFYYKAAAVEDAKTKWIVNFLDGSWCATEDECDKRMDTRLSTKGSLPERNMDVSAAMEDPFVNFNQVLIWYCDGGVFAGNRTEPLITRSGKTVYLRGRRILELVIDTLKEERFGMSAATEVLLTGGSAGGWATFMHADYVRERLPASITKLRAAPMSAWWAHTPGWGMSGDFLPSMEVFRDLHGMHDIGPKRCREQEPKDQAWRCMFSDYSWAYSATPIFLLQVTDAFVAGENVTLARTSQVNSKCALHFLDPEICERETVTKINSLVGGLVQHLQSVASTSSPGRGSRGAFISSCNEHTFYHTSGFTGFSIGGVTPAAALADWWAADLNVPSKWFLPCSLNSEPPYQCEPSCAASQEMTR